MTRRQILTPCVALLVTFVFAQEARAAWQWDLVHPQAGVKAAAIALDASGHPAIAYMDDDGYGVRTINLLRFDGQQWSHEIVVPGGQSLSPPRLAFDSAGKPWIAYSAYGSAVHVAVKDDGAWTTHTMELHVKPSAAPGFAIEDDRPILAYGGENYGWEKGLKYSWLDEEGQWVHESIIWGLTGDYSYYSGAELVRRDDGTVFLMLEHGPSYIALFTRTPEGVWSEEVFNDFYWTPEYKLALDTEGDLHVAYYIKNESNDFELHYRAQEDGSWTDQIVDTRPWSDPPELVGLGFDATGAAQILFQAWSTDYLSHGLFLARQGEGAWSQEHVFDSTAHMLHQGISATTDADGLFRVATIERNALDGQDNLGIGYVVQTPVTQADLSLSASLVTEGEIFGGDTLTYTLTAANAGPGSPADATLTDTIDPAEAVTTLTATSPALGDVCAVDGASITCALAGIPDDQPRVVTVTLTLADEFSGALTHGASIAAGEGVVDGDAENDAAAPISVEVLQAKPDLFTTKEGPATVEPGDPIEYTLTAGNSGQIAAANVTLIDTLPQGVTLIEASGEPVHDGGAGTLSWALGVLAPEAEQAFTVKVSTGVGLPDGTLLTNAVAITSDTSDDADPENDVAQVVTSVYKKVADLDATLTVTPVVRPANDQEEHVVVVTVTLTNSGDLPYDATYTATLPEGFELDQAQDLSAQTTRGDLVKIGADTIQWADPIAPLQSGDTVTFHYKGYVWECSGATCGQIVTGATVDVTQHPYLTTALSGTTDVLCPDLGVVVSGPAFMEAQLDKMLGTEVYEVVVTNHDDGYGDVADVALRLTDIAGFEVVEASPEPLLESDSVWLWRFEALAAGASKTVLLTLHTKTFQPAGVDLKLNAVAELLVDDLIECADGAPNEAAQHVDVVSLETTMTQNSRWWPRVFDGAPAGGTYKISFDLMVRYRTSMPTRPPLDALTFEVEAPVTPATLASAEWDAFGLNHDYLEKADSGSAELVWRLVEGEQLPADEWFTIMGYAHFTDAEVAPDDDFDFTLNMEAWMQGVPEASVFTYVETTEFLPVAAPILGSPRDGQACVGFLDVEGVAQRNMEIQLKLSQPGGELLEKTASVGVDGQFESSFKLTTLGVHTLTATTKTDDVDVQKSSVIELNVGDFAFDPQRTVWEGTLQAGYGAGEHRSYRFKDATGRLSAEDFIVPGEYGFWDTTLRLDSCRCQDEDTQPEYSVIADGVEYTQVGLDSDFLRVFNLGEAHQVEILRTCDNEGVSGSVGVLLIDPDGFIFDTYAGWGHVIPGATATCMWWNEADGRWIPWPAHLYEAQINPQTVDESGYFAFFTPPGFYSIDVSGPDGFLHWRSQVVEVIAEIVHVNVPYTPDVEAAADAVVHVGPAGLSDPDGEPAAVLTLPVGAVVEWLSVTRDPGEPAELAALTADPIVRVRSERDAMIDVLGWDSGMLAPGARYRRAFEAPGTFPYTTGAGHAGAIVIYEDAPPVVADGDGDGVLDALEMGPAGDDPEYDGDGDGTPDAADPMSASFPTASGDYLTVHTSAGVLAGAGSAPQPTPNFAPAGVDFPFGFVSWRVEGLAPGQAAVVTVELPSSAAPDTFLRYGPGPDGPPAAWYEFLWDDATQTGAELDGASLRVHVTDGAPGDDALGEPGAITGLGGAGLLGRARLGVQTIGGGWVASAPDGISCGALCAEDFELGAEVTLSATPDEGFSFEGWDGAAYECGTDADCLLVLAEDLDVVAVFTEGVTPPEDVVEPDVVDEDAIEPDAGEETTEEDVVDPDVDEPDAAQPDAAQPDTAQPDTAQPDAQAGDTGGGEADTTPGADLGPDGEGGGGGGCGCTTSSRTSEIPLSVVGFALFLAILRLRRSRSRVAAR
jgi:uncharacterized repeat protein (TIGR01451 family)